MGITRVDIKVCRVDRPNLRRTVKGAVVDTGAMVSAIPLRIVKELEIPMLRRMQFRLATGKLVTQSVGSAIIELQGRTATDDIIAISRGSPLVSVRALEGMGFQVDPRTGRLKKLQATLLL